ncbi:MAG TPA: DUF2079 domain-containing protein [Polyangiaceae bacterium]|nr:DUF2079 domain-containing protein [Polyangiaceae bacterium]
MLSSPARPLLPEGVRAFAGIAAIGASIGLALGELFGAWQPSYFADNVVPQSTRLALLAWVGAAALISLIGAALITARRGSAFSAMLARLLAPLALLGFAPGLIGKSAWSNTLELSISLAATVLCSRPLFRLHFSAYDDPQLAGLGRSLNVVRAGLERRIPARLKGKVVLTLAVLAAASYALYMATFTVLNHLRFGTYTWDLGQFDSEFFNTLHGKPFRCPALLRGPVWSDLVNHAHFGIWLLTPFYALHPAAETLLVLQALIVGAGAIPLYRFAARRLSGPSALAIAVAYLLYAPLHGAQFCDFHFQPIAASCVLYAVDFLDERRMRLFALFFFASLACREDISIGFASIGLYVLLFTRRTVQGAAIFAISAGYFVLMRFAVMPAFGSWVFENFYKTLIPPGQSGFAAVIVTLVTNPVFAFKTLLTADKLTYALQILTPVAFLPLSRPRLWLSLLLGTVVTLLTSGALPLIDIGYHYGAVFAPYVFGASVLAIAAEGRCPVRAASPNIARVEQRVSLLTLLLGTALTTAHFGAVPPRENFHSSYNATVKMAPLTDAERERRRLFLEAVAQIPKDAIVAAGDHELPQVSNRLDVWNMNDGYDGADYLLFDPTLGLPQEKRELGPALQKGWTIVAKHERFILLRKPSNK